MSVNDFHVGRNFKTQTTNQKEPTDTYKSRTDIIIINLNHDFFNADREKDTSTANLIEQSLIKYLSTVEKDAKRLYDSIVTKGLVKTDDVHILFRTPCPGNMLLFWSPLRYGTDLTTAENFAAELVGTQGMYHEMDRVWSLKWHSKAKKVLIYVGITFVTEYVPESFILDCLDMYIFGTGYGIHGWYHRVISDSADRITILARTIQNYVEKTQQWVDFTNAVGRILENNLD
jgi:hypothetical protein